MLINKIYVGDNVEVMRTFPSNIIDSIVTDPPYGLKFNNQKWDYDIPSVIQFQEMLRIAKPGAHLLCFGGSRTFHRIAVNIEEAGWELREIILWLYVTGFPKGINISKAFDKRAGAERKIVRERRVQRNTQTWGKSGMLAAKEQIFDVTEPATNLARLWDGYNTAIKPYYEPIIVAMKPMKHTYTDNALKYGVAGLNVGDCKIPDPDEKDPYAEGRWPANIITDAETAETMELESGWDPGLARRFFYCPKPDEGEKNIGLEDKNDHLTVKPVDLMRYLCTLTRPPSGGIVLDPFCGSGTTLMGAVLSHREWIGIDISEEYVAKARERVKGVTPDEWLKTPKPTKNQINMFEEQT